MSKHCLQTPFLFERARKDPSNISYSALRRRQVLWRIWWNLQKLWVNRDKVQWWRFFLWLRESLCTSCLWRRPRCFAREDVLWQNKWACSQSIQCHLYDSVHDRDGCEWKHNVEFLSMNCGNGEMEALNGVAYLKLWKGLCLRVLGSRYLEARPKSRQNICRWDFPTAKLPGEISLLEMNHVNTTIGSTYGWCFSHVKYWWWSADQSPFEEWFSKWTSLYRYRAYAVR